MPDNYTVTSRLVDGLVAHGLRHACLSPGSRSTPLALVFARHPGVEHFLHHDERSSAFFGLGVAKTSRLPCAIVTTSGTAAAELLPATVEARFGQVPLLLLTADRPASARGTGANQTIDQVQLYGTNAKWFYDAPSATTLSDSQASALAARAWSTALTPPAGPVHLNLPFEEPLVPPEDIASTMESAITTEWTASTNPPERADLERLAELVADRRGLIVAGPLNDPGFAQAAADLARTTGFPIVADPLSGVRAGRHDLGSVVAHGDALFQAGIPTRLAPEAVVRFGAVPSSKALGTWMENHPERALAVVDSRGWPDPSGAADLVMTADPTKAATGLAKLLTGPAPVGWRESWMEADRRAGAALHTSIGETFTELTAALALYQSIPDQATLWISSSMPIRYADLLFGTSDRSVRLMANRGASGVDGFLSSSIGSASAQQTPTYLLSGDLSVFYDLTALAFAGRHRTNVTIVAINNDGGAIFHLLPQVALPEFEELFAAPHGLDFEKAAGLFDISYQRAESTADIHAATSHRPRGPRLIEVRTDRFEAATAYRNAIEQVRQTLSG